MAVSKHRRQQWLSAWKRATEEGKHPLQAGIDALEKWRADPLAQSALPYWLGLEVWTVTEGLLVLAGVEPDTVVSGAPAFMSEGIFEDKEWLSAQPFEKHFSFSVLPEPFDFVESDFEGESGAYEAYLQRCEARREVLEPLRKLSQGLHHKLEHSPSALGEPVSRGKWRPVAFISWAKSIGYSPSWYAWAEKRNLLPDSLEATAAPYFDVDRDDYPALLHIAVRAWDFARGESTGTPKQRVMGFLSQRYPDLPQSTREAIALITNWRKVGGRPKKGEGV